MHVLLPVDVGQEVVRGEVRQAPLRAPPQVVQSVGVHCCPEGLPAGAGQELQPETTAQGLGDGDRPDREMSVWRPFEYLQVGPHLEEVALGQETVVLVVECVGGGPGAGQLAVLVPGSECDLAALSEHYPGKQLLFHGRGRE